VDGDGPDGSADIELRPGIVGGPEGTVYRGSDGVRAFLAVSPHIDTLHLSPGSRRPRAEPLQVEAEFTPAAPFA